MLTENWKIHKPPSNTKKICDGPQHAQAIWCHPSKHFQWRHHFIIKIKTNYMTCCTNVDLFPQMWRSLMRHNTVLYCTSCYIWSINIPNDSINLWFQIHIFFDLSKIADHCVESSWRAPRRRVDAGGPKGNLSTLCVSTRSWAQSRSFEAPRRIPIEKFFNLSHVQ